MSFSHRYRYPRSTAAVSLLLLAWGAFSVGPVAAQVRLWQLGDANLSWDSQAQVQAGLVTSGTSLHPFELTVAQNLTNRLKWLEGQPADLTLEGNPRVWDNSGTGGSLILVDGKDTTSTKDRFQKKISQAGRAFFFDLGVAFPVNRIRFYPPPGQEDLAIKAFEVLSSDGEQFTEFGTPVYESLRRVEYTDTSTVDLRFPVTQVRFLQLRTLSRDAFDLAEFEIYGEGFVPNASYLSKLHPFTEGAVNFGQMRLRSTWLNRGSPDGEPTATASVQVRSGADDTPLTYYRQDRESGTETEVTQQEYVALIAYEQGPIRGDAENWSPWSAPLVLDTTGVFSLPLNLPSPRQYLQFRVVFAGEAIQAIQLDQLAVEYDEPLVSLATGELALATEPVPPRGLATAVAGAETTFVCDFRFRFDRNDQEGFKGIRLASFPAPKFVRLELGDPLVEVEPDSLVPQDDGFLVYFPAVTRATNRPARLAFRTTVLEYVTQIDAWLLGAGGGLPQPVASGDAGTGIGTNSLQVLAADDRPAILLRLSAPLFTPNQDGANDRLTLSYVLSQFADQVKVQLDLLDLAGHRVARLVDGEQAPGGFQLFWDGTDASGSRVPPGVYLCRLSVTADAQSYVETCPIGVAY
ncbi:MAG: FlgD immunoglobulin-like domain containing protein [Candidatus Latescibacterota bacterium]|jgi:hypothetical protein